MIHLSARTAGFVVVCLGLLLSIGCAEKTPEQKLEEARSRYTAALNGWTVMEPPAAEPMMDEAMMGEEGEEGEEVADVEPVAEEEAMGEEGMDEPMMAEPVLKDVLLDILIRNESREKLAGVTVDISQADEAGNEMQHWRVWVDTSKIERGPGTQVDHRLEGVEIAEGYGFFVEVRHPVPAEDRADYREYSELP